jgi:hypothetical protein
MLLSGRIIVVCRVTVTKKGNPKIKVLELTDKEGRIGLACEGGAVEISPLNDGPHRLFSLSNYDVEFVPKEH